MIFRGLDLAYKAFRRARFKKKSNGVYTLQTSPLNITGDTLNITGDTGLSSFSTPLNMANKGLAAITSQGTTGFNVKNPLYNTGSTSSVLSPTSSVKVQYYKPTATTTTAATTANNIGGTTSTLAKNTYLPAYNQLKQTAWWAGASDDAKRAALQYMQDRAFSSTDGITMTPNGTELDITKAMDFADTSTGASALNWADQEGALGLTNGTWQGIGAGLNIANFGTNAVLGYLNYRNSKQAVENQNALNHANYRAQAKAYNTKLRSGNYIGRGLAGSNYTDEMRKADDAALKEAYADSDY